MMSGFAFFANRKLVTIFTAPRYQINLPNAGAVLKVAANGHLGFHTLVPKDDAAEPPAEESVSSSCFAGKEEEGAKKMAQERKKRAVRKRRSKAIKKDQQSTVSTGSTATSKST